MTVVPLKTKQPKDVLEGMEEGFKNVGGKPETAYTDDEGALNSTLIQDYFKEHKIKHITTRTHAAVAERAVRTIKDMIYKRLENNKEAKWYDVKILANSLVMYNYKNVSSATGFTPNEGREKK